MATPAVDPEEQRRLAEEEAARVSRVFFQTAPGAGTASPSLAGLGLNGQSGAAASQDRHTAFLHGPVDRQTVALDRIKIGRASWTERVGQSVAIPVVAVSLKKKTK